MKKLVFVINYFYPDVASTGQLMTELCRELQRDYRITVIAADSGGEQGADAPRFREERLEQIRIVRIKLAEPNKRSKWSRLRYVAGYFLFALAALLRERDVDLIYTISTPPVLGGLIGAIGKRLKGCAHLYNIQDFNPEQAEAIGYARSKRLYGIARRIDNLTCRGADHVVLVGRDMRETLIRRLKGGRVPAHSVIPNWTDERDIVPLDRGHPEVERFRRGHGMDGKFVVMYSGNIGLYYDLENLLEAIGPFRERTDLLFVFIGDGAVKPALERFAKERGMDNVRFLPFQPKAALKITLGSADVHLVVSRKGIKGVSVPSKIYGVLAAGKPVLGVLESGSEAERIVVEGRCGFVVEPGSYAEFVRTLERMAALSAARLERMGRSGREHLEKFLKKSDSVASYGRLLDGLLNQKRSFQDEGFGHRRDQGQSGGIDPIPGIAADSSVPPG
ncbi:glycosyltransferase family 4 protein [Cohnella cellulosilytica]|uniref:Glycosyltransferase family 4 protein n=1 Tax=Cohnella cellulosilytica TaxID=986710 RepID=A0ABW2FMP0_9BACL